MNVARIYRLWLGVSLLLLLSASVDTPMAKEPSSVKLNVHERAAIQLVRDFTNALENKDAERVVSYVEDNVAVHVDQSRRSQGKEALQESLNTLMLIINRIETLHIHAIGGPKEVMVIVQRVDDVTINKKDLSLSVGAFYRINAKTNKIKEWVEAPLTEVDLSAP